MKKNGGSGPDKRAQTVGSARDVAVIKIIKKERRGSDPGEMGGREMMMSSRRTNTAGTEDRVERRDAILKGRRASALFFVERP